MRKELSEYFQPNDDEFKSLWAESLISLDASVLLNVYGYSKPTRQEISSLIEKYKSRLVLPYQFALEYARNRASVIVKQVGNCKAAIKEVKGIQDQRFKAKRENPHLSTEASKAISLVLAELEESQAELNRLIGADPYADMILSAFDGCVGIPPNMTELDQLHTNAASRFRDKIPPGYEDEKEKGVPGSYGDYIGWSQLIDISKSKSRNVILVTDDSKEDWWKIEKSFTISPRPELLREFMNATGQRIWIYNSESFLRAAKKYGEVDVSDTVLAEVKETIAAFIESRELESQKPSSPHVEKDEDGKMAASTISEKITPLKQED